MKTFNEIMQAIDTLCDTERNKLLCEISKKYGVQAFPVGENFSFWFDGADGVYDEL